MLKTILSPIASLKLTIVLLSMAIVLVYAGTWAQVDTGIWTVQKMYFHSFFLKIHLKTFIPRPPAGQDPIPGWFPFLGGYSIGGLMLINLLAAHITRFKLSWKRSGVLLIHLGLILLIVGELLTSLMAHESQMIIGQGETANFSSDTRSSELVVIDPSKSTDTDLVISFPQTLLQEGATLSHSLVPFDIHVDEFDKNSVVLGPMQAQKKGKATAGFGHSSVIVPQPEVSGTEADMVDIPAAYVTLTTKKDDNAPAQNLGTYLINEEVGPQEVQVGDKTYLINLRFERHYKPYTMTLIKFSHDKYLGTEMARNFSSRVRLVDPSNNVDREVVIRMNEPLRYAGETYYQSSFKSDDKTTILQVVHNPAWTMPYIACVVGALGMLIHFGIMLVTAISKRSARRANLIEIELALQSRNKKSRRRVEEEVAVAPVPMYAHAIPLLAALFAAILIVSMLASATKTDKSNELNLAGFGTLPVNFDGRVQPMDTLARTSLQVLMGRSSTAIGSETASPITWSRIPYSNWISVPATRWLLDMLSGTDKADNYRVFRIDNPELQGMLGLDQDRKPALFSFHELMAQQEKLGEQMDRVDRIPDNKRGPFERSVADLSHHIELYSRLSELPNLFLVPPATAGEPWQKMAPFLPAAANATPPRTPASDQILNLIVGFHENDIGSFNTHVAQYQKLLENQMPGDVQRSDFEAFFNRFDPFFQSQILYVLVFVLGCVSWLGWAKPLGRAAFAVLIISLVLHTFGLVSRVYISGRPPVTNLYSSAVFIAWAGVVFSVGLESYFRNVIALVGSSAMGFLSLLIAHHLAGDGDTMKQLQAVLDTNGWLATHVVCVTLGYSATFLAGVLAIAYIMMGVFTRMLTAPKPGRLDEDSLAKLLPRMVYAILCFAILFSFVGTVLGGIWADQSWGRFWGWDPKENGAVLIVLWNALTLHARWSGIARRRGVMLLAVFGNVITSWSWFGTNMLGVGLHSYGFMDKAPFWLLAFVVSQLVIIGIGNIPLQFWKSFSEAEQETQSPRIDLPGGLATTR